jgi:hypothetical protein
MSTNTTEPTMTPYKAATLVNAQLSEMGIEKKLPPQMLYTYVSKGYIKSVEVDGRKRVTHQALADWFAGYVTKATKVQVTKAIEPSPYNFGDLAENENENENEA